MKNPFYLLALMIFTCLPSCAVVHKTDSFADINRIEQHLTTITKTEKPRNYQNLETLNEVADYIFHEFSKSCDTVYYQNYMVDDTEYRNVIGILGPKSSEKIVVGAHYDVAGEQEGADDNASGVVGLLELTRLLKDDTLSYQIEFVAYSLEEPPFFRTEQMGSYIHAKSLCEKNDPIKGMICLEMIGYFDSEKNTQHYPIRLMKLFYGSKGDFITVVEKFGNGNFGRQVKKNMKKKGLIETKSFKGPAGMEGVDFSDHLNYWNHGFSAVMITNTAFYRNHNYHKETDTMETLDLESMRKVIDQVYLTILEME